MGNYQAYIVCRNNAVISPTNTKPTDTFFPQGGIGLRDLRKTVLVVLQMR